MRTLARMRLVGVGSMVRSGGVWKIFEKTDRRDRSRRARRVTRVVLVLEVVPLQRL